MTSTPPPTYDESTATQTARGSRQPPPLPPRLPPRGIEPSITAMASPQDPRSASTQSLVPAPRSEYDGRRTLLLVFVHGFMGNETSFQNFPEHLHNLLTITMAESHTVHTKIYPRYRSRNVLAVARDDLSNWLTPHENPWVDVVLLGHSMGGLLAAEVALLMKHNIVGVINFDVPFLGMHPGIVKAGLGSIFNPAPSPGPGSPTSEEPEVKRPSRMSTLFNNAPADPNYNPAFANDVHLPVRKGWENALHFFNKHSNGLVAAGKSLVKSHIQFGSAMADYRELKARYARIRALEEDDEERRKSANPNTSHPPRVRFINYYTASTGRPKAPKSPKSPKPSSPSQSPAPSSLPRPASKDLEQQATNNTASEPSSPLALTDSSDSDQESLTYVSPRISAEEYPEDKVIPVTSEEPLSATSPTVGSPISSLPLNEDSTPNLPDIPPIPREPAFVDLAQYPDKTERKAAEKEHSKALKDYKRAVKARNAVINERSKIEEKWQKQQKQKKAQENEAHKLNHAQGTVPNPQAPDNSQGPEILEEELGSMQLGQPQLPPTHDTPHGNYEFSQSTILAQPHPDDRSEVLDPSASSAYADSTHPLTPQDSRPDSTPQSPSPPSAPKKKRFGKFCMLPPKDAYGNKDPAWVRVFMENMDEVTAHTSLFFVSETYERLVGDVGARIEDWVRESESDRLVRDMEGMD